MIGALPAPEGQVWIDLNEMTNRVEVGVESDAARAEAEQALAGLGIPSDAIAVEVSGPSVPDKSLQYDRFRPVEGGVVINLRTAQGAALGPCTFGFNAIFNQVRVFTTASHCTEVLWGTDGSLAYQPNPQTPSIGFEVNDHPWSWCVYGYTLWHCRQTDVALIQHTDSPDSIMQGYIARTTQRSIGWNAGAGSHIVDPSNPHFEIQGVEGYPWMGLRVDKMGQVTGWTAGDVIHTCSLILNWASDPPFNYDHYAFLCAYGADYYAESDDSGSPVFLWYGNYIGIAGIHAGHNIPGHFSWFSAYGSIVTEFGWLDVLPPSGPPTQLSVTISGPAQIQPGAACMWQASADAGEPPYQFSWYNDGLPVGTGPYFIGGKDPGGLLDHFTLRVDATDSGTGAGDTTLVVYESPSAPACFQ